MGQNGNIASWVDGSIPALEMGEAVSDGDIIGIKADASSRRVGFKALAAAGGTQVAAVGVASMDMPIGYIDAVRPNKWRLALPYPLPAALTGLVPGEKVWLSTATAGAIQRTKPSVSGQIAQEIGTAYWEGDRITGINAAEGANAVLIDIKTAIAIP
jgi:hypothetical protein